jgi:hypothetical protein
LPFSFQARKIVGSAVLVKARDRPEIEDDEFYSLDLVGMRVKVLTSLLYFSRYCSSVASLVGFSYKFTM